MPRSFAGILERCAGALSRRELFRKSGWIAAPAWLGVASKSSAEAAAAGLQVGPGIYESIGVRPVINCRGTFTIIGGSLELPEVRAAKEAAASHYVQLDELMEAVGKRLAGLTGAECGIVTSGCAAALAHATAACVAGGNPDLHVRIPNLAGFPKDEVIIPRHSRNVYDSALRAIGVRIVEPATTAEFEAALGPRVAMVYIYAGPRADNGPLPYADIVRLASQKNVPVLVDAAAEILTIPNVHLQRGATLVGYSGGKCIRGPQCAGLLLGRKDLVKAAWIHSAPHHGYGRTTKVGKEEIVGMLMAVEAWVKRDHKAEWAQWMGWLDHVARRVSAIEGVTTAVREPTELSNHSPGLSVRWDTGAIGITGEEVARILWTTEPRISLTGGGGGPRRGGAASSQTGVSVIAHMMSPGDEKVVADRLYQVLSAAPKGSSSPEHTPPAADIAGQWDVRIDFAAGASTHTLFLQQDQGRIVGAHRGDFVSRDLSGTLEGAAVRLTSNYSEQHGDALTFRFTGTVDGDRMSGDLDMGEYLGAKWTATRHRFGRA